jgi:hypothetical protein
VCSEGRDIVRGRQYTAEDALNVAILVVGFFALEVLSGDIVQIVKARTLMSRPPQIAEEDYKELVGNIFNVVENLRKRNPMSGMF